MAIEAGRTILVSTEIAANPEVGPLALSMYERGGLAVVTFKKSQPADEIADLANEHNAFGVAKRSTPDMDDEFFKRATTIHAVSGYCKAIGVDPKVASEHGIFLSNSSHNAEAVGEWISLVTGMGVRGIIHAHNMAVLNHQWGKRTRPELRETTVGMVGYGATARAAARKLHALGTRRIVMWDNSEEVLSDQYAERLPTEEDVLSESHVVCLQIPGSGNEGYLDDEKVGLLRPGAGVVNAARRSITPFDVVRRGLDSGQIDFFALDVHAQPEPAEFGDPFDPGELAGYIGVLISSHLAGSGRKSQELTTIDGTQFLIDLRFTGTTDGSMNMPPTGRLKRPTIGDRLIVPHVNHELVLGRLTTLLGTHDLNILPGGIGLISNGDPEDREALVLAFLSTNGHIPDTVLETIQEWDETRRPWAIRAGA